MSYSNYETSVVINTTKMEGVTSANGSYGINESPITVAGFGSTDAFLSDAPKGSFSFDRKMVAREPLVWPGDEEWNDSSTYGIYAFVKHNGITFEAIENVDVGIVPQVSDNPTHWRAVHESEAFDERLPFSGAILYGEKGFGFNNARLTRYSISCGIDEIPNVHAEFTVLGEVSPDLIPGYDPLYSPAVQIPTQGSIEVSCTPQGESDSVFKTNYVSNFSYEKTINLEEVYALPQGNEDLWDDGDKINLSNTGPIQVDIVDPVEIDLSFSIVINDYETKALRDRLVETESNHIEISIKNPETDEVINRFVAPYARLLSESVSASTDNEVAAELSFKSYMNKNWYGTSNALRPPMFLPKS